MSSDKVTYALEGEIAIITLNNPDALNAVDLPMLKDIAAFVQRAADEARCTILTGTGRGFCAGADLAANSRFQGEKSKSNTPIDMGLALDTHYNPLVALIREHPHPIITAVNGIAAGAGCSFALLGDMIIASEDAYFLQAFRRIGLVPDAGSTYILSRTLGRVRAMEMTLMGDKIPAEQAKSWGLVNDVVPADQLMPTAMEVATKLANGPTLTLGQIRKLIWDAAESDLAGALHNERISQRIAGRTKDFKEGVSAFLEKRKATFTGS